MPTIRELANAIRFLSVDAIQKAKSGHPGMPLGMADIATLLWTEFLQHNPNNANWFNRDRFVLSNGHGSMLQYSLLHLTGYDLTIEDIKNFRQLHSKTPGHPELGCTSGVETTTGPLGQGLANAVGMALAEKILAATFNRPGFKIVDNYTYVFVGDGCLMEGISHEVCSFAGTHALGKLIAFWDDNGISIDGHVDGWFTDNTPERFKAYGWHVVENVDGHDASSIRQAILEARSVNDKPSLICCKTVIGFGAPNLCGSHDCHGSPLGDVEIDETRKNLNWYHKPFVIPSEIYAAWNFSQKGSKLESEWQAIFNEYSKQYPDLSSEFLRRKNNIFPRDFEQKISENIAALQSSSKDISTRQASQNCIEILGNLLPEFLGGSADLTPSNLTNWSGTKDITNTNICGNYLHYGVREFGMFAIMNGISLYGGFIPYGGTFLVFASYGHSAIRMAAMMHKRVIYVLTHDSIGLGEDGPTHQPIEQLAMLRATPNLSLWRPCDSLETIIAWEDAVKREGPTCMVLSRQKLLQQKRTDEALLNVRKGGYILLDCDATPECIVIATGSEVEIASKAVLTMQKIGKKIRLVSMPSVNVFEMQSDEYKEMVLPRSVTKRVAVEAGVSDCWYKYVGSYGKVIGIDRFGESAPANEIFALFGLTEENIIKEISML